jgi:hypothetical protein
MLQGLGKRAQGEFIGHHRPLFARRRGRLVEMKNIQEVGSAQASFLNMQ